MVGLFGFLLILGCVVLGVVLVLTFSKFFRFSHSYNHLGEKSKDRRKHALQTEQHMKRGLKELEHENAMEAIEAFHQALLSAPEDDNTDILHALAKAYLLDGKGHNAIEYLRKVFDHYHTKQYFQGDEGQFLFDLGCEFLKAGDMDEAYRVAEKLSSVSSFFYNELIKNIDEFKEKKQKSIEEQKQTKASMRQKLATLDTAETKSGSQGVVAIESELEVDKHKQALSENPENTESIKWMADYHFNRKEFKLAADFFSKLIKLEKLEVENIIGISESLSNLGFHNDAIGYLRLGISEHPENPLFFEKVILEYCHMNDKPNARDFLGQLTQLGSEESKKSLLRLKAGSFRNMLFEEG